MSVLTLELTVEKMAQHIGHRLTIKFHENAHLSLECDCGTTLAAGDLYDAE